MKLWIDDIRDAPDSSWTEVRKVEPAIKFITMFGSEITEISMDHDIENRPDDETFLPVAYFIAEKYWKNRLITSSVGVLRPLHGPRITIHSINPVGAKAMHDIFKDSGLDAEIKPYQVEKVINS